MYNELGNLNSIKNTKQNFYRDPHSGGLIFFGENSQNDESVELMKKYKDLEKTLDNVLDRLEKLEAKEG